MSVPIQLKRKYRGPLRPLKSPRGSGRATPSGYKLDGTGLLVSNSTGQPMGPIPDGTRVLLLRSNGKRCFVVKGSGPAFPTSSPSEERKAALAAVVALDGNDRS